MTTVSLEEFKKMDIRIGTVISAEIVPDADKLLKLSVDVGLKRSEASERSPDHPDSNQDGFGEERDIRQIISGIRERVSDVESLVGIQLLFILNLEPRIIRGYESQGMLCAVGDDESFAFLVPNRQVPPGSKMR